MVVLIGQASRGLMLGSGGDDGRQTNAQVLHV